MDDTLAGKVALITGGGRCIDTTVDRFGRLDVLVAWLVTDEARFITGTTIMLDGGQMQLS